MKLRRWMIGISLFLVVAYGVIVYQIRNQKVEKLDITAMNDVVKTVEERLKKGEKVEEFLPEITYAGTFEITFLTDKEYDKKVYQALSDYSVLYDFKQDGVIVGKIIFTVNQNAVTKMQQHLLIMTTAVFGGLLLICLGMGLCIYFCLLRPFKELKMFAGNIAAGEFEFSLHMRKHNYFGAFTESFDLMRDELQRAKQAEYEANRSKKELVAGLSHDIKTPVSTIKAYCELLSIQEKDPMLQKKIAIINKNADRINALISDMFHATLEELSVLKIHEEEELSTIISPMFEEADREGLVRFKEEVPGCLLLCDRLRLGQVVDNVISNSYKYAHTTIDVSFLLEEKFLRVKIHDYGPGVESSELSVICEKFYRGSNVGHADGSGLGLYLSRQFMQGMKGGMEVYNEQGFVVELYLPLAGINES